MKKYILASGSPRRAELLKQLEIEFRVQKPDVEEIFPKDLHYSTVAEFLACLKADSFNQLEPNEVVITADTTVAINGEILGKPENLEHAKQMLQQFSGNTHEVITGVCLKSTDKQVAFSETTKVFFDKLSDEDINHYVDTYQPLDKAGSYGIQEWIGMIGVKKIEGSYFNVVGLPVQHLRKELIKF